MAVAWAGWQSETPLFEHPNEHSTRADGKSIAAPRDPERATHEPRRRTTTPIGHEQAPTRSTGPSMRVTRCSRPSRRGPIAPRRISTRAARTSRRDTRGRRPTARIPIASDRSPSRAARSSIAADRCPRRPLTRPEHALAPSSRVSLSQSTPAQSDDGRSRSDSPGP